MRGKERGTPLEQMHVWLEPETAEAVNAVLPDKSGGGGRRSTFAEMAFRLFAALVSRNADAIRAAVEYIARHLTEDTRDEDLAALVGAFDVAAEHVSQLSFDLNNEVSDD